MDHSHRTWKQHLVDIVNWFCFPVILVLEVTVPECSMPSKRHLWPLTFVMAMAWLSFFSYWICEMSDKVHDIFGIPTALLGLTLTAVGTSFPNCIASVAVARKGQSSLAIANALGSNIQNVFLALGFPWLINCLINGGAFPQSTTGINTGVISMAGSLVLFVLFLAFDKCRLGRPASVSFIVAYMAFCAYAVIESYVL